MQPPVCYIKQKQIFAIKRSGFPPKYAVPLAMCFNLKKVREDMKKLCSVILACLCIVVMCLGISAEGSAMPLWDNFDSLVTKITFSGTSGLASASISDSTYSADVTGMLTVYKQTKAGWLFICRETGESNRGVLSLSANFTGESGAYYKAEFSVTVTKNGVSEPATKVAYKTCP